MTRQRLAYPQVGRPLVPPPLDEVFGDELFDPWGAAYKGLDPDLRWRDLDESVWRQPPEAVERLAEHVVKRLSMRLHQVIRSDRMTIDRPVPLAALGLPPSIENALRRNGYVRGDIVLPVRVDKLARFRAVGARSLLSFLLHAQPFRAGHGVVASARTKDPDLRRAAAALTRRRWTREVSSGDPRFGRLINEIHVPATNAAEVATELTRLAWTGEAARAKTEQLRSLLAALERARSASLPAELDDLLLAMVPARHAVVLQRRFGWDGALAGTLREAGDRIGVTTERARQIQQRLYVKLERHPRIWTPALDRARQVLKACGRCSDAELARRLREAGISDRPFTRAALRIANEIFKSA
ncbi:MAG: sigma factor-like helix-turn-helix DNA-binding protein [Candidatus Limnocylindria bacterium]